MQKSKHSMSMWKAGSWQIACGKGLHRCCQSQSHAIGGEAANGDI
jgi:hypothetical protein